MVEWKRMKIKFPTVKLGGFIEQVKTRISDLNQDEYRTVYGVTNTEGITITGKESSKDISKYIIIDDILPITPIVLMLGLSGLISTI